MFARQSDEREVDRERAVVRGAGGLLVCVRARELVGEFALAFPRVALVVGLIVVLVLNTLHYIVVNTNIKLSCIVMQSSN